MKGLTWGFWWIRSFQCFHCIGDRTAKKTPETNFFAEWNKRKQCPGKLGVSNLEYRPYLNEKIPQEHFLIIRKISVVLSMWHVAFTTHLTFSCSKSTLETLAQGAKYVDDVILVFLLLTMNIFYTFFWCFHCCLWASKYQLSILITSASMVSVVFVPILVQFSLNIPPRLEGQFLQCCQRTVFRKLLFLFAQIQFFSAFSKLL